MSSNGASIQVKEGDVLEIELEQPLNPNYRWKVESNASILEQQPAETFHPAGGGIGAGSLRTLIFRVSKKGSGQLSLKNLDEKTGDVYQQFHLTVSTG